MQSASRERRDVKAAHQRANYNKVIDSPDATLRDIFSEALQLAKDLAKLENPRNQQESEDLFRYLKQELLVRDQPNESVSPAECVEMFRCYARFLRYQGRFEAASNLLLESEELLASLPVEDEAIGLLMPFWRMELATEHLKLCRAIPESTTSPELHILREHHARIAKEGFTDFLANAAISEQEYPPIAMFRAHYRLAQLAERQGEEEVSSHHFFRALRTHFHSDALERSLPTGFLKHFVDSRVQGALHELRTCYAKSEKRGLNRKIPLVEAMAGQQVLDMLYETLQFIHEKSELTPELKLVFDIMSLGKSSEDTIHGDGAGVEKTPKTASLRKFFAKFDPDRRGRMTEKILPLREAFRKLKNSSQGALHKHSRDIAELIKLYSWFVGKNDRGGSARTESLIAWYIVR